MAFEDEFALLEQDLLPDDASAYEIAAKGPADGGTTPAGSDFYENLAEHIDVSILSGLGARLLDEIKEDIESRREWEQTIALVMKYLGEKVEESKSVPFFRACSSFDTTLTTAVYRNYSVYKRELFPPEGPCKSKINGIPTKETEEIGERRKIFANYYLTTVDKEYYPDSEKLLLYTIYCGSGFRKIYQDPLTKMPVSRFIRPQDFIVNVHTTTILSSSRLTHLYELPKQDIYLRQQDGYFTGESLPNVSDDTESEPSVITETTKNITGIQTDNTENKSLFKFYECHVILDYTDLKGQDPAADRNIPCPYIVTICEATKKIVRIQRNWEEGDEQFKRKEYFVHYQFLPGFGMYGIGMAHLTGSNAITLTTILRQLIDAGTLKNFPGGLKSTSARSNQNNKSIGPAEWQEVETGGKAIQDCFMLMPYAEPSQVLAALRGELKTETLNVVAAAEEGLQEMGPNTAPTTALISQEVAARLQSASLMSMHSSLAYEFSLLFAIFGECLPDEPYPFKVPGYEGAVLKTDFNNNIDTVPVSNPNVLTSSHRLINADALLKLASQAPDVYNIRETQKRMLEAMNVENIDAVLKPEPVPRSLDAVSENMLILKGQPVKAAHFQNHKAHNTVHNKFIQDVSQNPIFMQLNPMAVPDTTLHIQQHSALAVLQEWYAQDPLFADSIVQKFMQQNNINPQEELSEEQIMLIPEVQNRVTEINAEEAMQQMEAQAAQQQAMMEAQMNQVDPAQVMLADVEQQREKTQIEAEVALRKVETEKEIADQKAETESFKTQLKFEGDQAKIEADQEMAREKAEVDVMLAEMKQQAAHEQNLLKHEAAKQQNEMKHQAAREQQANQHLHQSLHKPNPKEER